MDSATSSNGRSAPGLDAIDPALAHRIRARRRAQRLALAALLALVALVAVLWVFLTAAPPWWQATRDTGEAARTAAAELEQGVASEFTRVRGPGVQPWRVRLRAEDANAWLAARLPQWLQHDRSLPWPEGVGMPQLHLDEQGATLGAERDGRIASASWRVEPGAPGSRAARLVPEGAAVGRLPLPMAAQVGSWFVPELASPLLLEVRLGDGRTVRVVGAEFAPGEVVLDCETIAPGAAQP